VRRIKKQTFEELVLENKQALLKDQDALEKIEERLEQKMLNKAE
jgi:hypothetical protein